LLNRGEIDTQFPGVKITDITGPELNPDDYPDLWRVFMDLGEDWINDSGDLNEWKRFQNSVLKGILRSRLVVFREDLVSTTIGNKKDGGENAHETALFSYLGRYNPNIRELSESDLTDYPTITVS